MQKVLSGRGDMKKNQNIHGIADVQLLSFIGSGVGIFVTNFREPRAEIPK